MNPSRKMRLSIASYMLPLLLVLLLGACNKPEELKNNKQVSSFTSDVLDKWMTLQLRLIRNATGIPNHGISRPFAYSGVAALESLRPGLHGNDHWLEKWNGLSGLPEPDKSKNYYYPANVNAAMATINRKFFPNASSADKAAIDSLEAALQAIYATTESQASLELSSLFGKDVAEAVYSWSETDGYKNASNAYTVPVGPGLWKPTPPAGAAPATPYWGNNRTIITGSIDNTQPTAPVAYSTNSSSQFFQMAKQVYDIRQNLTDEQKALADFWKDVPGATSPGHWLSILQQVLRQKPTALDKAALAYALTGAASNDALISCFKAKYQYNLVRPVTYIREVMGHSLWNSFLTNPAHPEYPSAHSSLSSASADVLQRLFGNAGSFTDHTYDYLGYTPRTYSSYAAIAEEAGQSRLYAGIHYQASINAGIQQGIKVSANIFSGMK